MDFLGIGPIEVLIILLVAYLVLGPARMVSVARSLSSFVQEVRRTTSELPNLLELEEGPKKPSSETGKKAEPTGGGPDEEGPVAR